jgi:RimJ/RimL family protein N-acetyltransferase
MSLAVLTLTLTETLVEASINRLETERLFVRRFALSDSPFILKLLNQKSFIDNIRDSNVRSITDAENYLQKSCLTSYEKNGFGLSCVTLKDGTPIGMNGLIRRDTLPDVDIGFAFLDQFMGKGYAIESSEAVLAEGFGKLNLKRIVAITSPKNQASINVLERLEFTFDKIIEITEGDPLRLFLKTAETFRHRT